MRESFRVPVMKMMGRSGHLSLPRARSVKWTVYAHERMKDAMIAELGSTFQKGRHVLARVYGLRLGYERASLPVFNAARLVHMEKFEGREEHTRTTRLQGGACCHVQRSVKEIW